MGGYKRVSAYFLDISEMVLLGPFAEAVPTVLAVPKIFKLNVRANFSLIKSPNRFPESMSAESNTPLLYTFVSARYGEMYCI